MRSVVLFTVAMSSLVGLCFVVNGVVAEDEKTLTLLENRGLNLCQDIDESIEFVKMPNGFIASVYSKRSCDGEIIDIYTKKIFNLPRGAKSIRAIIP
ncbi:hypothetical protein BKA57DRAFT_471378 [Linnemannia elongata]|nr:hypothetical protein BKA57DRAFT_471378 [Linnemannia elongata]